MLEIMKHYKTEPNIRHIIPISGKDSLTTAIVQRELQSDLSYEYIFNDTHAELPETYTWLSQVEQALNINIAKIGQSLEDIIDEKNYLPSVQHRFCTYMAKIVPMEDFIGFKDVALVYYGIRADEQRIGYKSLTETNIVPKYPLQELGITLPMVWSILEQRNLLPPSFFWQKLYNLVVDLLGTERDVIKSLQSWQFKSLFAWRSRPNCYYCFFMRLYEWIGLLEHYPHLFYKASEIEARNGSSKYNFNQGQSLLDIAKRKEEILIKRAMQVCKILQKVAKDDNTDLLDIVSCGLYCGK